MDLPSVTPVPDEVCLVVDIANVMGSRPDGWWRDRAASASRLVLALVPCGGSEQVGPDGVPLRVDQIFAVVEGQARIIPEVEGVRLVRAPADGDETVVRVCVELLTEGRSPLAVTADRGLRARLPDGTAVAGPRWLLGLLSPRSPGARR
ncbi:MAG: hypothetical protein QG622_379 [Actinomycetota bacterium]|nr:hypothetical protein [Actinomycetota bacterium]